MLDDATITVDAADLGAAREALRKLRYDLDAATQTADRTTKQILFHAVHNLVAAATTIAHYGSQIDARSGNAIDAGRLIGTKLTFQKGRQAVQHKQASFQRDEASNASGPKEKPNPRDNQRRRFDLVLDHQSFKTMDELRAWVSEQGGASESIRLDVEPYLDDSIRTALLADGWKLHHATVTETLVAAAQYLGQASKRKK